MAPLVLGGAAVVAIITKLLAALAIAGILVVPAMAVEVWPDSDLTGGSVRIDGLDRLATCGHAKEHRGPMNASRRDEVLIRYGLPPGAHPSYEIDHLIPLCLGGGDDPSNLWPQMRRSIEPEWNAEAKDRLERRLCDMVCAGQLDIATAQQEIAEDWIAAYQKYFAMPKTPVRP
jgi:hypothetical protein